jgi:hypothetical protein
VGKKKHTKQGGSPKKVTPSVHSATHVPPAGGSSPPVVVPVRTPKKIGRGLHLFLKVFGTADLLLGAASMLLTDFFTLAEVLIYMGLAAWIFECWVSQDVPLVAKGMATAFIAALGGAFTWGIVIYPADPDVKSYWAKSDYSAGSDINGIQWDQGLSELRIFITNPTNRDFNDFDVSIQTNEAVFKIVQTTSIPCEPLVENEAVIHDSLSNVWLQGPHIGSNRFRCDKLPKHSTLSFLLALVNADELLKAIMGGQKGQQFNTNGGGDIFAFFGQKRKPQWVSVTAAYKVTFRPRQGGIRLDTDHIGML